jgi:DAACS family dicarboxylate/amino acid:cation (Na+ or H+) symporter
MGAGLALGIALRLAADRSPDAARVAQWLAREALDPLGMVFLRLLFFVVVPLVFASLALGVVQLGRLQALGPLAGRTFALFGVNMAVGVALGLLVMNTVRPGHNLAPATRAALMERYAPDAQQVQARAAQQLEISARTLIEMLLPANLLRAVVDFQILPLIVFALLVGTAALALPEARRTGLRAALETTADLMIRLVHFAMTLAPYAVAALLASVVVRAGFDIVKALGLFVASLLLAMAAHLFGTMSVLLKLLSRRRPGEFFRAIGTVLITAFSTSSSNATLPTSLQVSRERLGVSPGVAGFVLPLGATMNMSGTALYEGCVVLFVAQVFGAPLGLGGQVVLLLLTVLSAVAVAGIPGASLPLIVGLLATFNLPPEGIALIYGADRILDMARTTLNVAADLVTACIVDDRRAGAGGGGPPAAPVGNGA